jgi:hypothetical protein
MVVGSIIEQHKSHTGLIQADHHTGIEFFLPNDLLVNGQARASCSDQMAEILSKDILKGQCARLLYRHIPQSSIRRYILNISSSTSINADDLKQAQQRLIKSMTDCGFAARPLNHEDYAQALHSIPNDDESLAIIRLIDDPEGTDPEVTRILQAVLNEYAYLYLLDFKRLRKLDQLTKTAQCRYGLNLVIQQANQETLKHVQEALFGMYGSLSIVLNKGQKSKALEHLESYSGLGSTPHLGHAYTIANLIPA